MRIFLYPLFIFSLLLSISSAYSLETCSRIAIINYQEVLVDANTSEKGEGLRYHLEKDPIALEHLNVYQKNSSLKWPSAILGTAGTGMLLFGLLASNSEDNRTFIIAGASTILVNFLMSRTVEMANESNLEEAILEYNKRNLPKIFFNPEENRGALDFSKIKLGFAQQWTF